MQRQETIGSRRSGFLDDILTNAIRKQNSYLNRSYFHVSVDKTKFLKSEKHSSYKNSYMDKLKTLNRSKSMCYKRSRPNKNHEKGYWSNLPELCDQLFTVEF